MSEAAKTTATAQSEEIVRSQQPGELQNIQAAYRLNRKNYLKWSQLVRTVLKGKGKISHREWGQKGEQPRNNCHAHVAAVQQNEAAPQELGNLNQEEVERVRSLIGNLDKPSGTCSLAYSGAFPTSIGLNVSGETFANSWVMDSGATDHMTHSPNGFFTYFPCPSSRKIATADGSLTTVAGVGDVKIGPSLILKNVLHVPKLSTNLVSIQKLTQDLRCNVVFHHSYCVFQDEDSGRMIGHARERDGLYYLEAPSQSSITKDFKASNWKKVIAIGAVVFAVCVIFMILGILQWKGSSGGKISREKELKTLDLQTGFFTFKQIRAATNNFDAANKIGEGGFGSVYKGILLDGTIIAVKQLSSNSNQGNREFVNEIGMISGLQHPNLVRLYGCCIEGNQLFLVYEYMENNSLARALFGSEEYRLKLDWLMRQKICLGIARGLAFLHEESTLKIVHRDIKTTNVLLDRDLNPKISDFGLAKLDDEENTHINTRVAGTTGYMALEYALWGYLTNKADVYSFGVVALEIVAGKNNMKYRPNEKYACLLEWALVLQKEGNLMELVDAKLGSKLNKEEVIRMIKVALLCTNPSPALRPTMSSVVSMLEGQTIVDEVTLDPSIYGDELGFSALRDQFEQLHSKPTITSAAKSLMNSSDMI